MTVESACDDRYLIDDDDAAAAGYDEIVVVVAAAAAHAHAGSLQVLAIGNSGSHLEQDGKPEDRDRAGDCVVPSCGIEAVVVVVVHAPVALAAGFDEVAQHLSRYSYSARRRRAVVYC